MDPETGRVVDREVMAAARARRSGSMPVEERLRAADAQVVEAAHDRAVLAEALERAEREAAAAREGEAAERALRADGEADADARLRALEREAHRLRGLEAETIRLRAELAEAEARASSLTRALEGARADATAARELLDREREEAAAELERLRVARDARADALDVVRTQATELRAAVEVLRTAPRADAARIAALERELAERSAHEEQVREALATLGAELDAARAELERRAARDAQVEALVTGLVEAAEWLRGGYEREVAALLAERDARSAQERLAFAGELAAYEERLAALRARADGAEGRLERERAARQTAETALAALRAAGSASSNPFYDTPRSSTLAPTADHPALARRPEAEATADREPPAVVVDLVRAAARLRAAEDAPAPVSPAEPHAAEPDAADRDATDRDATDPDATAGAAAARGGPGAASTTLQPPMPGIAPPQPWMGAAFAALAAADSDAAERLLCALLPLQATRVRHDVAYALVLPGLGRRDVTAGPGAAVAITDPDDAVGAAAEFTLVGSAAALAPLVTGAAPRRKLPGVVVKGRRRRLRRLLRALERPAGLDELADAVAPPRAADLLALLCVAVPAAQVRGSDFRVAYEVAAASGERSRTLVRAAPDGSLTVTAPSDGAEADATVTADAADLPGVLAGTAPTAVAGDADAVATLQAWLRRVQRRLA